MNKRLETIDLKGKAYATVPTRIKEFRADCPFGLIETTHAKEGDSVVFTARVLKDKSNPNSAEATGHAMGKLKGDKDFEKLETISIGRALAILGYMAGGDVASGEEMLEFYEYQEQKWVAEIGAIETLDELRSYYLANKGRGKEFDECIKIKKEQLTLKP